MKNLVVLLGIVFAFQSCTNENSSLNNDTVQIDDNIDTENYSKLMINNCYSCHNPNAIGQNKIAPTLAQIKEKYKDTYTNKNEFITAMTDFVLKPTKNNAILQKAIDKFGIMPNMQFASEDVEKIINYIYETDIETDDWMKNNYTSQDLTPTFKDDDYLGLGRHIVMSTKKQLGKNLKQTIKNKGTKAAVTFCNLNAFPIIDSMSTVHNASIIRVSNKARNPNNIANQNETTYILNYQQQLDNGEELHPILEETNDLATFYMPIVTNDMCLQCHGEKNNINKETLDEIKRLYPKDLAIGYSVNQIRGIWKVELKK